MIVQVYLVERLDADRGDQLLHMKVRVAAMPVQQPTTDAHRPAPRCTALHSCKLRTANIRLGA
jgi:hypothetical protein